MLRRPEGKHRIIRSAVLALFAVTLAMAQSDRGSITGTVLDPTSAVVPAARISVRNLQSGTLAETQSTATGNFTIGSLSAGEYEMTVEAAGLKKSIRGGLRVQVAQTLRADVTLEMGAAADAVTVTARADHERPR
jgi:hypothetical protein